MDGRCAVACGWSQVGTDDRRASLACPWWPAVLGARCRRAPAQPGLQRPRLGAVNAGVRQRSAAAAAVAGRITSRVSLSSWTYKTIDVRQHQRSQQVSVFQCSDVEQRPARSRDGRCRFQLTDQVRNNRLSLPLCRSLFHRLRMRIRILRILDFVSSKNSSRFFTKLKCRSILKIKFAVTVIP